MACAEKRACNGQEMLKLSDGFPPLGNLSTVPWDDTRKQCPRDGIMLGKFCLYRKKVR